MSAFATVQYAKHAMALTLQAFTLQLSHGFSIRIAFEKTTDSTAAGASTCTLTHTPPDVSADSITMTANNINGNVRGIARIHTR